MFIILDYSSALEYSIIRRYTNIVYYYYYYYMLVDFQEPYGVVVLLQNDLVVIDLNSPG